MAPSTRGAYASDLRDFEAWAHANGVRSMPATPETVAAYLTRLTHAGLNRTTFEPNEVLIPLSGDQTSGQRVLVR